MSTRQKVIEVIEGAVPEKGEFTSREVAEKVLAQLEEEEPTLLAEYQRDIMLDHLTHLVSDTSIQRRSRFRRAATGRAFKEIADNLLDAESEEGRTDVLDLFKQHFVVDHEFTRKPMAEMTRENHLFVADRYKETADYNLLQESFHRAVAKKIGKRLTGEVFDGEKLAALYKSITKGVTP